jgi:hypothetical protein
MMVSILFYQCGMYGAELVEQQAVYLTAAVSCWIYVFVRSYQCIRGLTQTLMVARTRSVCSGCTSCGGVVVSLVDHLLPLWRLQSFKYQCGITILLGAYDGRLGSKYRLTGRCRSRQGVSCLLQGVIKGVDRTRVFCKADEVVARGVTSNQLLRMLTRPVSLLSTSSDLFGVAASLCMVSLKNVSPASNVSDPRDSKDSLRGLVNSKTNLLSSRRSVYSTSSGSYKW